MSVCGAGGCESKNRILTLEFSFTLKYYENVLHPPVALTYAALALIAGRGVSPSLRRGAVAPGSRVSTTRPS